MRIVAFVPLEGKAISLEIKVNSPIPIKRKSVPFFKLFLIGSPLWCSETRVSVCVVQTHGLYSQDFLNGTFIRIDQLDFI